MNNHLNKKKKNHKNRREIKRRARNKPQNYSARNTKHQKAKKMTNPRNDRNTRGKRQKKSQLFITESNNNQIVHHVHREAPSNPETLITQTHKRSNKKQKSGSRKQRISSIFQTQKASTHQSYHKKAQKGIPKTIQYVKRSIDWRRKMAKGGFFLEGASIENGLFQTNFVSENSQTRMKVGEEKKKGRRGNILYNVFHAGA